MRIPRVYIDQPLAEGLAAELPEEAARHVARVLRLRAQDPLVLFDGRGGEYAATLEAVARGRVSVRVGEHRPVERESPLAVTLAQGVSRGERMDYTIRKAVELGVARIVPVLTRRTTVQLKGERQEKRVAHWQGVVNSACEQCGRNRVPPVAAPCSFEEFLEEAGAGVRLILHGRGTQTLKDLPAPQGALTLFAGPEGGFDPEEIAQATAAGFAPLRLGPRILRTETAGVAALAALQTLWGDLSTPCP